jgi:hypothetical protein
MGAGPHLLGYFRTSSSKGDPCTALGSAPQASSSASRIIPFIAVPLLRPKKTVLTKSWF